MYAMKLPPEMVARLYRLREEHRRGPIRRQVLSAVEGYLTEAEMELGVAPNATPSYEAPTAPVPRQRKASGRGS